MTKLEEAREFFKEDRFAVVAAGIVIDEVSPDYAKCSMKITKNHQNAIGALMGGAYYTLADFVFAVASNFDKPYYTVTTVSQISYLSPCKGDTLIGESKLIRNGKHSCFYQIELKDNLGNLCAIVSTNGTHIPKN